jgi:hypothetical protein
MTDANTATHSIVIERVMPHPPEKVWHVLTQGPYCLARACRVFSPVRPQRRIVAADVVWPARANVLGAGEITGQNSELPSDDRSCIGLSGLLG